MNTLTKRTIALVTTLCLVLATVGCGASSSSGPSRTTLENIRAQFPPLEEGPPPEPLEEVVTPTREQPDAESSFSQRVLQGQSVPFSGLLLSDAAAAFVASEYEALTQRFGASLTQQRQRDFARLVHLSETMRLQINSDRERFLIIAENQETYINSLERALSASNEPNVLEILAMVGIGALGILVGIVVGILLN